MNNLNVSIIEGNLVALPELKTVGKDLKICEFSIANNQGFGEKQHVNYFDIKVFGKNAENCQAYLQKGQSVKVIGLLKQERWKKPDGGIGSRITIEANQVIFGFKKEGANTNNEINRDEIPPDDIF
jgi:single-strand DNA-binding protein